jgi:uncharacterized protein (TIGR02594 family)
MTPSEIRKRCLEIATAEVGVKEIDGTGNNPRIVQYHTATALRAGADSIPWCSAFVNWVLREVGVKGTGSAAARSFLTWGKKCDPEVGCVVVLQRGGPAHGHVGFYVRDLGTDYIKVLGGNQSDCVKVSNYKKADVLGYRTAGESV